MASPSTIPAWQRAIVVLSSTVVAVVAIAFLYWAQAVLIPVALAVFLTFLLAPLVTAFQQFRLGRTFSVLLVVLMAGLVLGSVGWLVSVEATQLASEVPHYTENIKGKIQSLREMGQGSVMTRLNRMVQEVTGAWQKPEEIDARQRAGESPKAPSPAAEQPESPRWVASLSTLAGRSAEVVASMAMALVLLVFMLLKREDLRNRLIRLVGYGQITATTKALDDAGQRISRFLLMQLIVNGTFGIAVTIGMLVIGVEHAFLWGFLAAVLRYIPYIGPWIAATGPILLSLAMFEGWVQPLLVIGLFLVIELISNNVIEPLLYGRSIGVSEVALLVAAAFWTFLWGPMGLVLSSPMTVCLMVLGKYVPRLKFLDVLLGDEPPLTSDVMYYQRVLARDQDEATQVVLSHAKKSSPEQVYDELLLPALNCLKQDRERGELTESDERFVLQATREILEDLGEQREAAESVKHQVPRSDDLSSAPPRVRVLVCPARDEADHVALGMLHQLLDQAKWDVEITSVEMLTSEFVTHVAEQNPALVCIGALPPGGLAHTRYLCKRLRTRFPAIKILVGRWGFKGDLETDRRQLQEAGADWVATTLLETRSELTNLLPVLTYNQARVAAG